jgi:hypothetical protein
MRSLNPTSLIAASLLLISCASPSKLRADVPSITGRAAEGIESAKKLEDGNRPDPLAREIERQAAYLRDNPSTDPGWLDIKQSCEPLRTRAVTALRDGRRYLALVRVAAVEGYLGSSVFQAEQSPEQLQDTTAFVAAWERMGQVLRGNLAPIPSGAMSGVAPALVRAVAEAALPQVREYYEASLDYERATDPPAGFLYLGYARAERDLVRFCHTLSDSSGPPAPVLRDIRGEVESLQACVLKAYRPPASMDRHGEFILVSGMLKEARELNAAGLRYGALLRYLQAAVRSVPLCRDTPSIGRAEMTSRLQEFDSRLSAQAADQSLGRLFLEQAESELATARPDSTPPIAAAIATDVLPRYFAALGPAPPASPGPVPRVTITLVRWPYT